jgi:hypothetical protein
MNWTEGEEHIRLGQQALLEIIHLKAVVWLHLRKALLGSTLFR